MSANDLPDFPWDAVAPYFSRANAHSDGLIDLSVGSPVDPTPQVVRAAIAAATDAHGYPPTIGSAPLREAIVAWYGRRRGVPGLTVANALPTIGSKELIALLPTLLVLGPADAVVHPRVAYPTYAVGARMAGARVVAEDNPANWPTDAKLIWINTPGNPNGRTWTAEELAVAVARAREIGAILASDECYAELGWSGPWATQPIPSVLDPRACGGSMAGLLSVYSLSKQSNLAGYRAAFIAGDSALISSIGAVRKHLGLIPPAPVQAAMIAALGDDSHVAEQKILYRERRDILLPALEKAGFRIDGSEAGLYLWATEGEDCWITMGRLADRGILAGPGVFYGQESAAFVRFALTARTPKVYEATTRLSGGL